MKPLFAILLVCVYIQTAASDIRELRNTFRKVAEGHAPVAALTTCVDRTSYEKAAVLSGYRGMCHLLAAREYLNPISKWNCFRKGSNILDKAIAADSANPEIRMLRLSVQLHAPRFIGYHSNIEEDKHVIIESLYTLSDEDLKARIINFMAGHSITTKDM